MLSCLIGIDLKKKSTSNVCDFLSVANRYLSLFKQRPAKLQTFLAYFKGCTKKKKFMSTLQRSKRNISNAAQ